MGIIRRLIDRARSRIVDHAAAIHAARINGDVDRCAHLYADHIVVSFVCIQLGLVPNADG